MNNIENLNQNIINCKDYKEINKDNLSSKLSDTDYIVLIRDVFVYKGNKMIFKGSQKTITKKEFCLFLKNELTSNLYKNYIVLVNNKEVYTINEDGVILQYNINSKTKNEDNPSSETPPKRPPNTFSVFD